MDQQILRETLIIRNKQVTEADRILGEEFNQVAMMALNRARRYLLFGPESSRLAITKQFLSAISKLSNISAEETLEQHREQFLSYLSSETQVTHHLTEYESKAITASSEDQDIES